MNKQCLLICQLNALNVINELCTPGNKMGVLCESRIINCLRVLFGRG